VSLIEDVKVKQETLAPAPVELTRAQAVSRRLARTSLIPKATSRAIRDAHLIPTTPIETPEKEPVRNIDDLLAEAFRNRPELEEARLEISNSHNSLEGSRNELLPELDLVGVTQNAALTGQANSLTRLPRLGPLVHRLRGLWTGRR
jgi:hypothetical protein